MLSHLKNLRFVLTNRQTTAGPRAGAQIGTAVGVSEAGLDLLGLAIASLEKLAIAQLDPQLCQVAVLGPTQAGKSTLVNALVGAEVTTVSALAGHTRHARGAASNVVEKTLERIGAALQPATRVAGDSLSPTDLDQYSLAAVDSAILPTVQASDAQHQPLIVWDTPDFDSLAADTYRRAVLAIAGMADVIVLIVSRDKYGDMAVWELLERLSDLQRRSVLVVNKVDPASWTQLHEHIEQTQTERLGTVAFDVAAINHAGRHASVDVTAVLDTLGGLAPVSADIVDSSVHSLINDGWDEWLAPVLAEDQVQRSWREEVGQGKENFLDAYRRDYLADADRYDTFQRLLGELLVLLEIPLLARSMGSVRKVVTWPVRKLFGTKDTDDDDNLGREPEILQDAAVHLLLGLRMTALEGATDNALWGRLAKRMSDTQAELLEQFHRDALTHHQEFQQTVTEAAQLLYQRLQESPALLNSLRAVRASADAAGVVVALQTGGIGLADLVLTPAMLSLTSTLTESAAKTYVDQVVAGLQEKQHAAVSALLDKGLGAQLASYADDEQLLEFGQLDAQELRVARDKFLAAAGSAAEQVS